MWSSHSYQGVLEQEEELIVTYCCCIWVFYLFYLVSFPYYMWSSHTFVSTWKATSVSRCIGARGGVDCYILLLYISVLSFPYIMWSSHMYQMERQHLYQGVLEQEEKLIVTLRWLRRDHPSWHSVASGTPAVSDQSGLLYFYQLSCGICIERWKIFVIITAGPQSDSSLCALVSYSKLASAWLLTIINLNWQIWAELNNSWCQVLTT